MKKNLYLVGALLLSMSTTGFCAKSVSFDDGVDLKGLIQSISEDSETARGFGGHADVPGHNAPSHPSVPGQHGPSSPTNGHNLPSVPGQHGHNVPANNNHQAPSYPVNPGLNNPNGHNVIGGTHNLPGGNHNTPSFPSNPSNNHGGIGGNHNTPSFPSNPINNHPTQPSNPVNNHPSFPSNPGNNHGNNGGNHNTPSIPSTPSNNHGGIGGNHNTPIIPPGHIDNPGHHDNDNHGGPGNNHDNHYDNYPGHHDSPYYPPPVYSDHDRYCDTWDFTSLTPNERTEKVTAYIGGSYVTHRVTVRIGSRKLESWEKESLKVCVDGRYSAHLETEGMLYNYSVSEKDSDSFFGGGGTVFTMNPISKKPTVPAGNELAVVQANRLADGETHLVIADTRAEYYRGGKLEISLTGLRLLGDNPSFTGLTPSQIAGLLKQIEVGRTAFETAQVYDIRIGSDVPAGKYVITLKFIRYGDNVTPVEVSDIQSVEIK